MARVCFETPTQQDRWLGAFRKAVATKLYFYLLITSERMTLANLFQVALPEWGVGKESTHKVGKLLHLEHVQLPGTEPSHDLSK